jgi:DNA polymerase-1
LKQLLADNVLCVDTMKSVTTTVPLFVKEYGFEPKYILDYLALVGDSADNIK